MEINKNSRDLLFYITIVIKIVNIENKPEGITSNAGHIKEFKKNKIRFTNNLNDQQQAKEKITI